MPIFLIVLDCPPYSEYSICDNVCSTTCAVISEPIKCPTTCSEGCVCQDGYFFNGKNCLPVDKCGCYEDGKYYRQDEEVLSDDCRKVCTCRSNGVLECQSNSCGVNETCKVVDGVMKCVPDCETVKCRAREKCEIVNERPKCIPLYEAYCYVVGDPHYRTFDGKLYEFQGTCTYTIAKTCGNSKTLTPFNIEAKNENRGITHVSYVSNVTIQVYGQVISFVRLENGFVRVDNQRQRLPMSLNNGQVQIYQSGIFLVILTDFSLKIFYDWNSILLIYISSSYYENICGMCGYYNEIAADDLTMSDGKLANTITEFGNSWQVGEDKSCCHDCGDPKPCPENLLRTYHGNEWCGIIADALHGPFRHCHSTIDPKGYVDNCVYDVCFNGGSKKILCQSLVTYASVCQSNNVLIEEWRWLTGCDLQCPDNSEYKLCGKGCPLTCNDRAMGLSCSDPCTETCQCNEGFVLDGGKCIPKDKCGCIYNGKHYAPYEQFWGDSHCVKQCTCNPTTMNVDCKETGCKSTETCSVVRGIQGCYPISYATCTVLGDPHYIDFDGVRYDFQGSCVYLLAGLCRKADAGLIAGTRTGEDADLSSSTLNGLYKNNEGLVDFQIIVTNENRGRKVVSYTGEVQVNIYDLVITMSQQKQVNVQVNGVLTNLPYSADRSFDKVTVYRNGYNVILQTRFGLRVSFDWNTRVAVTVPSTYRGAMCGLCGQYNGTRKFVMKNGDITDNPTIFGKSWKVRDTPQCSEVEPPDCPNLKDMEKIARNKKDGCGVLLDPNGPFRNCHKVIDPEGTFKDCVFDGCFYNERQDILCKVIASYAASCQEAGVEVYPWRSDAFCRPKCGVNSHYEVCATGCVSTCFSLSPPLDCNPGCSEGCVCEDGYILSGDECVPLAQCGCTYLGIYYKTGEKFFVNEQCNVQCECTSAGSVQCTSFLCGINEECKIIDGIRKCHPVTSAHCSASGDPHYITFDGLAYDFQGNCTYTLTKTITSNTDLIPFTVNVKNEKWPDTTFSVTKLVSFEVFGHNLVLKYNMQGQIMVDGILNNLPLSLDGGKIKAYIYGIGVKIDTDFEVQVSYDLVYEVIVTVPGNYKNQLCGLCGNYNDNQNDDFQLPNQQLTTDIILFGDAWKIPVPGEVCDGGCGSASNPCPECDEATKQRATVLCGLLKNVGPLSSCFEIVKPDIYYENCVYDVCATDPNNENIHCQLIQNYVAACQAAGGTVTPWRAEGFCVLDCPPYSEYSICDNVCSTTCAVISEPIKCPTTCSEGCVCQDGYFFNGKNCLPVDKCGCYEDGKYYRQDEEVLSDDCRKVCTCRSNGVLECQSNSCGVNETCKVVDGVMKCVPDCETVKCRAREKCEIVNERPKCIPLYEAYCYVVGDPHYRTFDGKLYEFQGTCTYTIAKTCGNSKTLTPFNIEAKNENRGITHVSYVSNVTIQVYGQVISFVRLENGFVRVDNQRQRLPISLNNGQVQIYQSGIFLVILTDFSLKIFYDWNSILLIYISSSYYENICGMCGYYNEIAADDLSMPDGKLANTITEFGNSWQVGEDKSCCHDCGDPKPCPENLLRTYHGNEWCGIIADALHGPFRRCHSTIDPKGYVDNCVYDVCFNGGSKKILCQSLVTYASVCQSNNVLIEEWRRLTGCDLQCPDNSEYKLCGKGCPLTCNDRAMSLSCSDPCTETCQCNEGFVLDGGKCIPKDKCGCIYNGKHYAPNEQFWGDSHCEKKCTCNPTTKNVDCKKTGCKSTETCSVVRGIQGCYPISYATCTVLGDPHYIDFDGVRLYKNNEGLVDFQIIVTNENRGRKVVSFTGEVQVNIYDLVITMSLQEQVNVQVNGVLTNLPYSADRSFDKVTVYRNGYNVILQTRFGLRVSFDWNTRVAVTVPSTYRGAMCGLCGQYNGTRKFVMRNGDITDNPTIFGKSWKVRDTPQCSEVEPPDCPNLKDMEKIARKKEDGCGVLLDPNGPFRNCHKVIDPEGSFKDCVFDGCFYNERQDILCKVIASYAASCQEAGVEVYPWRSDAFCRPKCGVNSHYEVCATGCVSTCFSLSPPLDCNPGCSEGCVCEDGYILSGDECVPLAQCGCTYLGIYYKTGEKFFVNEQCNVQCECTSAGSVQCTSFLCGINEECKIIDGIRKCHPVTSAHCSASGDPHYITFDGLAYDFQGNCSYTLTKTITSNTDLIPFTVNVKNEKWPDTTFSVTKLVSFEVFGHNLVLKYNMQGQIMVDGILNNLPLSLDGGKIKAYIYGIGVKIDTDFEVQVSYDLVYEVIVTVPGNYKNQLCGLCGNYNDNQNDDFQLPNQQLTTDIILFGDAWKIPVPGEVCDGGCGSASNPCPECDEATKQRAIVLCGLLKNVGPLSNCFEIVKPDIYYENCVYDVCATDPNNENIHCQLIQNYVAACQAAGGTVTPWRAEGFCVLDCPPYSEYSICSNVCSTTCAVIAEPIKCPTTCSEGCVCQDGYFFNGKNCLPVDKCGCYEDGKYYRQDEDALSDDCKTVCTCRSNGVLECRSYSCGVNETCKVVDGVMKCVPDCETVKCRAREKCVIVNQSPKCIPLYEAYCYVVGDPHYRTFDGKLYEFQGTCTYTIAKTCGNSKTLTPFNIEAKNENRGITHVSYVSNVTIQVYGQIISFVRLENGFVRVDNQRQRLPVSLNNGQVQIYQSGIFLVILTDFSLKIFYDWNSILLIYISSSYYENICGMGGYYNEIAADDLSMPDGKLANTITEFGKSWQVGEDKSCCHDCGDPIPCPENLLRAYHGNEWCGIIADALHGPFRHCHSIIDPKGYVDNCVYDVCFNGGSKKILCQSLVTYASVCQSNNVLIEEWRRLTGCDLQCPDNSEYKLCVKGCPLTCNDRAMGLSCSDACTETCQCNEGFVLDGGKCIPKDKCGCIYNGKHYAPNEQFWGDSHCEKKCTCNPTTKNVDCKKTGCKSTETCSVVRGIQGCYPISYATCTSSGDPHYVSFDGVRYDFQGSCVYLLAGLCKENEGLVDFQINVENGNRGSKVVSYTNKVNINIFNLIFEISRGKPGKVQMNGVLINLPYYTENSLGKLSIYREGDSAILQTSFGLRVSYNWDSRIAVKVPGTYGGAVCGLCGNFNGDKKDEFVMQNGLVAKSPTQFAKSWKVKDTPGCSEDDGGSCPKISDLELRYRNNKEGCGILLDEHGPFRECLKVIDPEGSFKDCVFDACIYKEHLDILCKMIASYATSCHEAGPTCGNNSHYETCASGCAPTCFSLNSLVDCHPGCSEGCVCDRGFILSGNECVPISQCGCVYMDLYYKLGEKFFPNEQCDLQCECVQNGLVNCHSFSCGPNEECKIADGVKKCYPKGSSKCSLTGGSHYISLDDLTFNFQGNCTYTLIKTKGLNVGLEPFTINVKNEKDLNLQVPVTKLVSIEVYNYIIKLQYNTMGQIKINDIFNNVPLTLEGGKIRVYQQGTRVIIDVDFGLQISFDLVSHVIVTVPSNYMKQLGGLCGNYNGDKIDDFQLPSLALASDVITFGAAWKVQVPGENCSDGCGNSLKPCPVCDENKNKVFKTKAYCGFLNINLSLMSCHKIINPDPYHLSCLLDLCKSLGDLKVLCRSIQSYVTACQAAGVNIQPWRTAGFCPMKCPPNSSYKICANVCTTTCASIKDPGQCPTGCNEGCECDKGYFFNGKRCVSMEICGCFYNGKYYQPQERILSTDCTEICTCGQFGVVFCKNTSCATDETCETIEGITTCVNKDPCKFIQCRKQEICVIENKKAVCKPIFNGTFWGWGEPHYKTFDGFDYDFQGTFTYILSTYTGDDDGLVPFTVEGKNENRGTQCVSFLSIVNIYIYGFKISLLKCEFGKIRINDEIANLPQTLFDGKISASISGFYAVVNTDFGLQVTFDYNSHVTITLSSSYCGLIGGLGGNFNQDTKDELMTADKKVVPSILEWVKSWKVNDDDPFGFDVSPADNCTICNNDDQKSQYGDEKRCGLISKKGNGPFRECHAKVNPDIFFNNCLYDVCVNGGAKQLLCQALSVYARTCRSQGIKIYDWRTPSRCDVTCPVNSHYEFCGSACPATCMDRNAPSSCTQPCVETCQCNDGFVLFADKCVIGANCGFRDNGGYVPPSENFWYGENCHMLCKGIPVLGMVVCMETSCKANEVCSVVNGVRNCYPSSSATCSASGSLHYKSFDGYRFDFIGTCLYQLVDVTSQDSSLIRFTIKVQNNNHGNKAVSHTKTLIVEVYDLVLTFSREYPRSIMINGIISSLPFTYKENSVVSYISGNIGVIKTVFGVTVSFDWNSNVEVTLPNSYINGVTGLCGNYNMDSKDDLNMRNGKPATNVTQFGNSWKVDNVPGCLPECTGNCTLCSDEQKLKYADEGYCGLIIKLNGPFTQCLSVIDPTPFFNDCIFDACQYQGHPLSFCNVIGLYVAACQHAGIQLFEWRSGTFCVPSCPPHSQYKLCGNSCPVTCRCLSPPGRCKSSCKEGCYCEDGFILSGSKCVPISQCGCVYLDQYYQKNEIFFPKRNCNTKCQCEADGSVICELKSCNAVENCNAVNGNFGCFSNDSSTCVASGEPHYISLDGRSYDFQGICTYIFAKTVLKYPHLVSFTVTVQNERYKNFAVSVTKEVVVSVYGYTVTIQRGIQWKVKVDGEVHNLPLTLLNGKLSINQEGNNIVLQTDFGLSLLYDTMYYVLLKVPSSYMGKIGGLCGNFNGDPNDDFQLPNGLITKKVADFGQAWRADITGVKCSHGCKELNCQYSDYDRRWLYMHSNSCGMITNSRGPFKECHYKVKTDQYYNFCLYDVTLLKGKDDILCKSLQAYTAACQSAGVNVLLWRTPAFCPMSCPANSHYELCARTCDNSCYILSSETKCTGQCFEGCVCDTGYLYDGEKCVTIDKCGCVFEGRYMAVGESLVNADCSLQCKCQFGGVICKTISCSANEQCLVRNEVRNCYKIQAYCEITSQSFTSFDGLSGESVPIGPVLLVSLCNSDNATSTWFRLLADVQSYDTNVQSIDRLLIVLQDNNISISNEMEAWVNEQSVSFPLMVNDMVSASIEGATVYVKIGPHATAELSENGELKVGVNANIPSVCGACGNFNGASADDLLTPKGKMADNIAELFISWRERN
ncbi:IgGFc-binding protein-like [Rhinoderma darwinii]|uniref:IgGFc-binding protein-like n=1 Tax=Rhinoderma darwinii TaxID=43563 RepID=UPI003F67A1C7